MPKFPENIADLDHATFDMGLVNASRKTRERLQAQAFREHSNPEAALNTYSSLRVPWWLETKYETPWELKEYRAWTVEQLTAVLGAKHGGKIDVKRDDVKRLLQHLGHRIVYNSMPLHVGYEYPETGLPYTAEKLLERSRYDARRVATTKHIPTESDEHPLWMRGKTKDTSEGPRRLVDATQPQISAAQYLVGSEFGARDATSGPLTDAMREALPMLLEVDNFNLRMLSSDLRGQFKTLLADAKSGKIAQAVLPLSTATSPDELRSAFQSLIKAERNPEEAARLHDLKRKLVGVIVDTWMQINATSDAAIKALQETGKPDVLQGEAVDVLKAYVDPHIEAKDVVALKKLLPLIGYHTIGGITMENDAAVDKAIKMWSSIAHLVDKLPPRIIDLAFIACRVALADSIEELKKLREQM